MFAPEANWLRARKPSLAAAQEICNLLAHSIQELPICLDTGFGDGGYRTIGSRLHGAFVVPAQLKGLGGLHRNERLVYCDKMT